MFAICRDDIIEQFFIVPFSFRAIHSTTHCSCFEDVYGFNPPTLLDLLHIHSNIFVSKATTSKADQIKTVTT